jgi:hypothetical protein
VDLAKIEAIMECPPPTNVPEVRSFMGLAGYYLWFIEGFSKIEKSDHGIAEEKPEVCLDREMRERILEAQGVVDKNTDTKGL